MRLGVLSDIHAQVEMLQEALGLLNDCDLLLCAGDINDQSRFDARTLGFLCERGALAIKGNNDFAACGNSYIQNQVAGGPHAAALAGLAALPAHRSLVVDGLRIGLFHGSPWDDPAIDYFHYVYPEAERDLDRVAAAGFDVVILGHTHRPMSVKNRGVLILNPGSCGCGNPPSCAVLHLGSREVEFRRLKGGSQA